jgi:hypothetical protein
MLERLAELFLGAEFLTVRLVLFLGPELRVKLELAFPALPCRSVNILSSLKFRSTIVGGGGTVGKGIDVPELKLRGAEESTVVPNKLESVDEVVGREVGKNVELFAEELVVKLLVGRVVGRVVELFAGELAVRKLVGRVVGRVVELFAGELAVSILVGRLVGRVVEFVVKLLVGSVVGRAEELAVKLVVGRLVGTLVKFDIPFYKRSLLFSVPASLL